MKRHVPSMAVAGQHRYTVRVYYEDTDAGGVVYHANYLRFAERARTEALRDLGIPHAELVDAHGLMFVVQRMKMEYARPARLDDVLVVVTEALQVGGASVTLRQEFRRADAEDLHPQVAVLEVKLACVATASGRPDRVPDRWRRALHGMRTEREEE